MASAKKDKQAAKGTKGGMEETLWQAADKLRGHMDAGALQNKQWIKQ